MTQETDLAWWRQRTDYWLTPIEKVKEAVLANGKRLDRDYPNWGAKAKETPTDYLKHDARRVYFITLRVILQNAQLSYIFMRDQLSNKNWYMKQTGTFRPESASQALREYALMVKFFTVHAIAMATEETFRAIVRSAPSNFTVDPTKEFQSVYRHMLKILSMRKFEDLFEVLRLVRNTIHTNGVFFPPNRKNVQLSYVKRQFNFEVGKTLDWLGEEFLVWIATQLNDAMSEIVTSPVVASIPYCPRGTWV